MRRNNNAPRGHGSGGPLMTEHLQLQDLDLELELLKRKREMIELQQHQLLSSNQSFNRPRPFDYGHNKPRPLFQEQHQPFTNSPRFSQFYDEPQQPQGFGGGGLLGKRPMNDSPPVWQTHSAPKRFSGPQSGPKKKFGAGPSPKSNYSMTRHQGPNSGSFSHFNEPRSRQEWENKPKPFVAPKSSFPSQRFNNTPKGAKPQQRDFKPNKVTKSKPPQQGNKLASYPTPERKNLVKKTTQSSKEEDDFTGAQYILRPDKVPSQQMAGRLELALGNILKEIKTKYGNVEPHNVSFQSQFLNRKMKQGIRERLRGVMLGKPVGKVAAIVESYRKVFPPGTDSEILDIALAEQQFHNKKQLAIKLEKADTAFRYLRVNMNKLIEVTLDDMFKKLKEVYEHDAESTKDICEKIKAETMDFTKDVESEMASKNDSAQEIIKKEDEIKLEDSEIKDQNGENIEENPSEVLQDKSDVNNPTDDGKPTENENLESSEKPAEDVTPSKDEKESSGKPEWKNINEMITNLIKRKLPYILPKFKPQLMKILNAVSTYRVTKTAILERTQHQLDLKNRIDKAEKKNRIEQADKNLTTAVERSQNDDTPPTSTPNQNQSGKYPYVVQILGHPVLPKRDIMQAFLDEFKPMSVKKHRNMHLLFLSFKSKDAFDKIIAVKETTLGNCNITIKASEKSAAKINESLNNSASNDSSEKIIGSDLDEQINDLLSSIRQEEEGVLLESESGDMEIVPGSGNTDTTSNAVPTEDHNIVDGDGTDTANETNAAEETGIVNDNTAKKADDKVENEDTKKKNIGAKDDEIVENEEAKDKVEALRVDAKESGRATPSRASARLNNTNITPSSVRTRRASRLAQN